jgi:hypothetical protein
MKRRTILAGALVIAMAVLPHPAQAQDKVTLRLDWVFGTEHSGVWAAQEKGFFKDENLDVRVLPGEGSSVTVKLVGTGDVDFGYATADQALLAYSRSLAVVTTAARPASFSRKAPGSRSSPIFTASGSASSSKARSSVSGASLPSCRTSIPARSTRCPPISPWRNSSLPAGSMPGSRSSSTTASGPSPKASTWIGFCSATSVFPCTVRA